MKIILPIRRPEINTYEYYVGHLVPALNHKNYTEWIFSNFIELAARHINGDMELDFCSFYTHPFCKPYCPLLRIETIYSHTITENKIDIIMFTRRNIKSMKYVYIFLDEFYVKGQGFFRKKHFVHDFLVYGFNDESKCFLSYVYSEDGQLQTIPIDYSIFAYAFQEGQKMNDQIINLLSLQDDVEYPLNIPLMRMAFQDSLSGESLYERLPLEQVTDQFSFGINVYDDIIDYSKSYISAQKEIDICIPHLLLVKNQLMQKRVAYLTERGILFGDYEKILNSEIESSKFLLFLFLKYNRDRKDNTKIIQKTTEKIKKYDEIIYSWIYSYLVKID